MEGSLGQQAPKDISIHEDPFILKGSSSAPFDDEGVDAQAHRAEARVWGRISVQLFSQETGHEDHQATWRLRNLRLSSRLTQPGDDLPAMLRRSWARASS